MPSRPSPLMRKTKREEEDGKEEQCIKYTFYPSSRDGSPALVITECEDQPLLRPCLKPNSRESSVAKSVRIREAAPSVTFVKESDIDSDGPDISPPPLHAVRDEERAAKVLQDIGRGRILKREENLEGRRSMKGGEVHLMQDYEDIGGRKGVVTGATEGRILKNKDNLELKRSGQKDEDHLMQEGFRERGDVASRANESTSDTFEWVDFKRNEGLPSGVILASESLKDNFEDAKDYEAVQLIRAEREGSTESSDSFYSALEEIKTMVDVGTQTDDDVISCLIM